MSRPKTSQVRPKPLASTANQRRSRVGLHLGEYTRLALGVGTWSRPTCFEACRVTVVCLYYLTDWSVGEIR